MDALHYAYPGANPAAPAEVRWRGKVYASSTDSVDEVVVDGLAVGVAANSAGAAAAAAVLPTPTVVRAEVTETLFYPPPPRSPPPRKPPDALRAVLWWVQGLGGLVGWARRTFWPALLRFFDLSFWSGEQEELYRRDSWFTSKQLAFTASLFYILNTILAISLIPRPLNLYNKITYFGVAPLLTVPITLMVLFNAPKFRWAHRLQLMYQPTLMLATWCWSWFSLWDMWACGYYETPDHPDCGNKDFLSTFYFSTALPVLALFALGQHRFYAALGAAAYLVIMCVLILPERTSWVRNVVNFMVFQAFLIYVHYMRETAERRIFILREQLKAQFKVTEKAQDLERRASDSKKRFVSYIFHEVRVPLNTALLAVQNLAPDILSYRGKDDIEFGALEGSLNMMSKVLNDVLDFNRMDSGRFESISSPFCFHNVIRTMLIPLELAAQARGLSVTTELDRRIDEEANRAAAAESGLPMPLPFGADEGWVLSDEMRLRQLVTNLTSNACKFTATGGKIHVRTTLVKGWAGGRPSEDGVRVGVGDGHADVHADGTGEVALELDAFGKGRSSGETAGSGSGSGSGGTSGASGAASPWRWKGQPAGRDSIVVRIEVEDTGVGIRPRDIMANQLFSPYVQTEIGRYQGGKGTGLGLALVRHIVKLSGGRLGVRSKVGRGSTFWVELALGVGKEAIVPLTERRELAGDDEGGFGAWPSTQPQVQQGVNGNGSGTETLTDPPAGRGMRIPMPPMGVVDPRAMEGATPSTQASTRSGLLDTPLSDDSAMRTILEHDGMFELTSRRAGGMPSPVGTIRSPEPAATKFDLPSPIPLGPILSKSSSSGEHDPSLQGLQPAKSDPSKPPPTPGDTPPNAARAAQAPPPQPPTPAEEPLPVLVVDDDHLTRRLMARLLTRLGCVADCAEDGSIALNMLLGPNTAARALRDDPFYAGAPLPVPPANGEIPEEQVDQYKYGVVFLDNQMPFYSGVQVVYKLRELGRDTFVVGVTGNALAEDQQEYLDAGVDRVLTKPVMEKDLRAMVALARNVRKKKLAAAKAEPKLPKSSTPSTSPTIRG